MKCFRIFALVSAAYLTSPSATQAASYQLNDSFTDGRFSGSWTWIESDPAQPVSVSAGSLGQNSMGSYWFNSGFLKMTLTNGKNYPDGSKTKSRFEVVRRDVAPNGATPSDTAERTYIFDVKIPSNWDVTEGSRDIIMQLHPGGNLGLSPILAISLYKENIVAGMNLTCGGTSCGSYTIFSEDIRNSSQGDLRNKWIRFRIDAKFAYDSNGGGAIRIWRTVDGVSKYWAKFGINTYNTGTYNHFKIGHYLGAGWHSSILGAKIDKILYFDNVSISKP